MRFITVFLIIIAWMMSCETAFAHGGRGGMPSKISAPGVRSFVFSPRSHMWGAYDASGNRVASGVANGGNSYCPDVGRGCHTPTGTFRIISKGGSDCRSTRFPIKRIHGEIVRGGAPMPYCMFFTTNFAIHGYPHLTNANVSHGCIRVATSAALRLRQFLPIGAKVIIRSY